MNKQVPGLFEEAVRAMTIHPDHVTVIVTPHALAESVSIRCHPDDAPRLVGRRGQGINAISRIARHLFDKERRVSDMSGKLGPAIQDDGTPERERRKREKNHRLLVDILRRLVDAFSPFGHGMRWLYASSDDGSKLAIYMITEDSHKGTMPLMRPDHATSVQSWLTIAASAQGTEVTLGEAEREQEAEIQFDQARRAGGWGDALLLGAK